MKKFASVIVSYFVKTDKLLWLLCFCASGYGAFLIYGLVKSEYVDMRFIYVQLGAVGLGIICATILSALDYRMLAGLWKLHVPVAYFLVILTFIIGTTRGDVDDRAWLQLPLGMTLQPGEFLKLSFILSFAYHCDKVKNELNTLFNVIFLMLHGLIPVLLIHYQGDDGTALIFAIIFVIMFFSAGLSWRYILPALGALLVLLPGAWLFVLSDDQRLRFLSIISPESAPEHILMQQLYGRISLGSGGLWGVGVLSGNHRYIPEMQNDFIFAYAGEAAGLVGCGLILLLIILISVKVLATSGRSLDNLGKYICVGVFAMIMSQAVINIGMCISLMPVIGVTLPFFSGGGSSVLALYLGIGLVLSVHSHNNTGLFTRW